MTTSRNEALAKEAYVWIWLPGSSEPVPCGRLFEAAGKLRFHYGRRYLERRDAIPIFSDLPLERGVVDPVGMMTMPASIRDASPDAWGRRVIEATAGNVSGGLGEIDYLLRSGSDRVGALDFQETPSRYVSRPPAPMSIDELHAAAQALEEGRPLSDEIKMALQRGTSIGGARPKTLFEDEGKHFIAKYSLSRDVLPVNKVEAVAMKLAKESGLSVADVHVQQALDRDVLMIERFDRQSGQEGMQRRAMVSALTVLGLDEMEARYAGYDLLADHIRQLGRDPEQDVRELFSRMTYNIICGNTDDHARNHAFFWDGSRIKLTPAYDVCPQVRSGGEASQAMRISGERNDSTLAACLEVAPVSFGIPEKEAREVISSQLERVSSGWKQACDEVGLSETERSRLLGRQFLNPFMTTGLDRDDPLVEAVRLAHGQIELSQMKGEVDTDLPSERGRASPSDLGH